MSNKVKTLKARQQVGLVPGYILLALWCIFIFIVLG